MTVLAVEPAASQQDISAELAVLEAEFRSASARALPANWTGGLDGLSLVFELNSPLPAALDALSDTHRHAARAICRKVGADAVAKNRAKPGLGTLRFFVVELKSRTPGIGPLKAVKAKGLVFDAEDDCREVR